MRNVRYRNDLFIFLVFEKTALIDNKLVTIITRLTIMFIQLTRNARARNTSDFEYLGSFVELQGAVLSLNFRTNP